MSVATAVSSKAIVMAGFKPFFTPEIALAMTKAEDLEALKVHTPNWNSCKAYGIGKVMGHKADTILKAKANGWTVKMAENGTLTISKVKRSITVTYTNLGQISTIKGDGLSIEPGHKDKWANFNKHLKG